ncbi:MAG: leucine-rich repeat domain-containing protein [Clostridium sp.]|jgi:internalin A|uniref:leucine-rich repeat domain-containing protein n=1 Tax=Clostridium sp. TaxID=1506 RepID=UPI0025BBBD30|nr:leucine-rich repeat domain-containing protein [Clostridium sp.]MCH3965162.1 leucine-rich repeat domain-containing protein [Clostridium sp.]MCI1714383.1 leucine-rich repeat domain-containing protein [Clostridium sp.]MCI1798645.1 leucine-rich repeat domain-containing protein [Clostridium sp.]MCI1812624.1 leucine-rich repeat domain-containing protein [Clostridium sp.]MCI1869454.1 leucine-rich repeat domain-containing protein [Clostridium sp.]
MKNRILTAIFFSAFLLIASNNTVQAASFKDNQMVPADKTWTIVFNSDVGLDNGQIQGLSVTDSKSNTITVDVKLGNNNKTVIVTPPASGYKPGESYTLNLGNKLHSIKGKPLKKEYKLHFNIQNDYTVTFKDSNLEKAVRDAINKPTGDIYKSDVEKITELNAEWMGIQDLSGIENLTSLRSLHLYNSNLNDISPLKNLTNLQDLDLCYTGISDITQLKNLTNLEKLNLGVNQISDISALKELKNLKTLDLGENEINDISPLEGLTNLKNLDLNYNQIQDITPLKNLTNLTLLILYENQISDITPLKKLTKLYFLDVTDNQISNINTLKGLTNLKTLYLDNKQISADDLQALESSLPNCNIKYERDYK